VLMHARESKEEEGERRGATPALEEMGP
jgi:hypothetical protein